MATDLYELAVRFKSEGFKAVSKDMDTLEKKGKGISTAFAALKGTLLVGAVGGFLKKVVDESIEAQKQTAQLEAVLKSTGGVAGVTASEIDTMAKSLQSQTTFSDEAVKSAASLLLTFTNIRGEIFKNTLPVLLDMSQALGQDLKSSAIQVGKALQDPIKGITALRRVGVAFSPVQQEVIKKLVETNQLAKAQGLILKELQVEFGGSAAAARNTLGGALEGLKNSWGDLFEVTTDGTKGVVGAINRLSEALDENKEKWQGWAASILDKDGGSLPILGDIVRFLNKIIELQNKIGEFWGSKGGNQLEGTGPRGGGGGGGRDQPTGPLTMPGVTVMAGKPSPLGGAGGKAGKQKKIDIPDINPFADVPLTEQDRINKIGQNPLGEPTELDRLRALPPQLPTDWLDKVFDDFHKMSDRYRDSVLEMEQDIKKQTADSAKRLGDIISGGFAQTLGDSIYNAFAAAFDGEGIGGILKAFGKTMLAGVGQMFTQLGMVYLEYGILMQALASFLPNPFTAGWAGVAIGAALIAMGAALGAVGKGAGRGTAQSGAFRENPGRGTEEITRFKFLNRDGSIAGNLTPLQPIHFTVIGANDPVAQRQITELVTKASRRAA